MFHGNADVGRGFSINEECLVENLKNDSLVAQRLVFDEIQTKGGLNKFTISKSLIFAARNASSKRIEAFKSKQSVKEERRQSQEKIRLELRDLEIRKIILKEQHTDENALIDLEVATLQKKLKTH